MTINNNKSSNERSKKNKIVSGWSMGVGFMLAFTAFLFNFVYLSIVTRKPEYNNDKHKDNFGGHYLDIIEERRILPNTNTKHNNNNNNNNKEREKEESNTNKQIRDEDDWRSESSVFRHILQRAVNHLETCDGTSNIKTSDAGDGTTTRRKKIIALPAFGIINAISGLLAEYTYQEDDTNHNQCYLPPAKSCNKTGYSVVLMRSNNKDYTVEKLIDGIRALTLRSLVKEIILVWNNSDQQEDDLKNSSQIIKQWDKDPLHPLRIFHHSLGMDYFTQWHPSIKPKMNAVLYLNENDPFVFTNATTTAGFELWKRNSAVPVSGSPHDYPFELSSSNIDDKMYTLQYIQTQINLTIQQIQQGWQSGSPYEPTMTLYNTDTALRNQQQKQHPSFSKFCQSLGKFVDHNNNTTNIQQKRQTFNYFISASRGTFIHKNLLCFVWHPIFKKIRKFVNDHPSHPYDIAISTILSQVTGKAPRLFPIVSSEDDSITTIIMSRNSTKPGNTNATSIPRHMNKSVNTTRTTKIQKDQQTYYNTKNNKANLRKTIKLNTTNTIQHTTTTATATRRKLDIVKKDRNNNEAETIKMKMTSINSIIGFFGSLHPGAITGWCIQRNSSKDHFCYINDYGKPSLHDIPWMNSDGLGFDQC